MLRRLIPLLAPVLVSTALLVPAPAWAESRVGVANGSGDARIDPTYATTLSLTGSGFQSVVNGHGGIYVFFGAVERGWQPSHGGATGVDYFYVPDSESRDNQGFQKYVAFPGSDTASSANGGTMSRSGAWSTTLVVPAAVFRAYDRDNDVREIDCRRLTCGVITIGAHGVTNARNETFTPVSVGDLTGSGATATPTATAGSTAPATPEESPPAAPSRRADADGAATLEVDRPSAVAGRVLAFAAGGLPPGTQVSVVLDDGAAGAGPFVVGADGRLAGVLTIPAGTATGTHQLRLFGVEDAPAVRFAVTRDEPGTAGTAPVAADTRDDRAAVVFAGAAGLVLLLALLRLAVRTPRSRRAS